MTRTEAVAKVQRIIGFRSDRVNEIIEALQEAQRELEKGRTLPFFLREEDSELSLTANIPTISLPERWLREIEDEPLYWLDTSDGGSDYTPLEKVMYDQARAYWQARGTLDEDDQNTPLQYALRKSSIYIFPTPSVAMTFYWTYFKGAQLLTTDIENAWLSNYPDLLIGRAAELVGSDLRDQVAVQKGQALYARWAQIMANVEAEREVGGASIAMGSYN